MISLFFDAISLYSLEGPAAVVVAVADTDASDTRGGIGLGAERLPILLLFGAPPPVDIAKWEGGICCSSSSDAEEVSEFVMLCSQNCSAIRGGRNDRVLLFAVAMEVAWGILLVKDSPPDKPPPLLLLMLGEGVVCRSRA